MENVLLDIVCFFAFFFPFSTVFVLMSDCNLTNLVSISNGEENFAVQSRLKHNEAKWNDLSVVSS